MSQTKYRPISVKIRQVCAWTNGRTPKEELLKRKFTDLHYTTKAVTLPYLYVSVAGERVNVDVDFSSLFDPKNSVSATMIPADRLGQSVAAQNVMSLMELALSSGLDLKSEKLQKDLMGALALVFNEGYKYAFVALQHVTKEHLLLEENIPYNHDKDLFEGETVVEPEVELELPSNVTRVDFGKKG